MYASYKHSFEMDKPQEVILELPWDVAEECNGFGLDFGGSVCKVVYLHKDDWQEPGKRTGPNARIRCVRFSRSDFDKALSYLKDRVSIRRKTEDEKPLIYTTGVGGSQFSTKIRDTFGIRTSNVTELECFIAAFNYALKNMKRGELLCEIDQNVVQKAVAKNVRMMEMAKKFMKDAANFSRDSEADEQPRMKFPQELPLEGDNKFTDYKDLFPCFLVMVGSNGGIFVCKEDGTYEFANDMKFVGRAFLGLGSVLTGSKSYEELMSKAEKGDMHNVHEYLSDITKGIDSTENADNMYGALADNTEDEAGFLFGKCVFKDIGDFKSEDLARSFLHLMVGELVSDCHVPLRIFPQVKHIFFCGGFPDHPLTREFITQEWIAKEGGAMFLYNTKEFHHTHFMKHGSHFGALGAYLNQKLKFKVATEQ